MTPSHRLRPLIIVASICALGAVVLAGVGSPLRPLLAVWFLLTVPGLALAPLLRLDDAWGELAVVLSISVAVDIVVATALMYGHAWSPALIVVVLAAISLAGAAGQLRHGRAPS